MTVVIPVADVNVVDAVKRDLHFGRPQEVHEGGGLVLRLDRRCNAVTTATSTAEYVIEESTATLPPSADGEVGKVAGCGC